MTARPPVGIRVEGLRPVVKALVEMGFEVEDLKDAFSDIAREAVPVYQSVTPIKSGRLRGDYRGNRAKSKAVVTVGRSAVPYAAPIQWGWPRRNIAPHHYVQDGDRLMEPRVLPLLENNINRLIEKKGLNQ